MASTAPPVQSSSATPYYRRLLRGLSRWDALGMAIGAASLLFACIIGTRRNPYFWYDEIATWSLVRDPSIPHMVRAISHGAENNPPLFELVLRPWVVVLGTSELSLRIVSALFMVVALLVMWSTLRHAYSTRAVAAGVGVVFFGGQVILDQIVQARFYGFFAASVAVAIAVGAAAARRDRISRGLLAANFAAHVVLLFSHVFGGFYSAAILAALIAIDLLRRRVRPMLYASIVAAWLVFLVWIPATLNQSHVNEPRSWLVLPQRGDLFALIGRQTLWLPLVAVAIVVMRTLFARRDATPTSNDETDTASNRLTLVALGTAVIAVVPAIFVFSRLVVPVFLDRYLLPSALGWAIIVAHLADMGARKSGDGKPWLGLTPRLENGLWAGLFVMLSVYPLVYTVAKARAERPSVAVDTTQRSVPIVVESALQFWPLQHYAPSPEQPYRFLLDWELAIDSSSYKSAVQEYKVMALYRDEGYLPSGVEESANFLCANERFLVVDSPDYTWFERRIAADSAFEWSTSGRYGSAEVRDVRRKRNTCLPGPGAAQGE